MLDTMPELDGCNRLITLAQATGRWVTDTNLDYLPAFAAADAMVSDQSSLIPEFAPLRRPILYTHREGQGRTNGDSGWVSELPHTHEWSHVAAFLDDVRVGRACLDTDRIDPVHLGNEDKDTGARVAAMICEEIRAEVIGG